MNIPDTLQYTKSHEWVKKTPEGIEIGLTDYAQSELGDLVFVNFPEEGDELTAGEAFGDVESVKAVSDIYSPITGIVTEVNEDLLDSPQLINENPYSAWLIRAKDIIEQEEMLSADQYIAFIESEKTE